MNIEYKGYNIKEQPKKHNNCMNIYVVTKSGRCLFVGDSIDSSKRYINNLKRIRNDKN